ARLERDDGPPRGAQDMFRLARVLVDPLARPEEALAQLVRLLEREPGHAGAAELLERLVAEHPSVAYLSTVQLEAWYARAGDWSHLAEILRTQIDRFPDEIAVVEKYRALAELYETRLDDVDGAFLYMSHAFRQDPGSEAIHDRLLGYAERRGAWDQLFDLYLDVLMELETAAERNGLRRKMAKLFHDTLGDLERAEMLYRDILDDDPRDDFACERLTDLYRGTEEWEKLADVLRQAERVAEGKTRRVRLLFEISRICSERLGAGGEAMDALESVLSLDPKSWDAYRALETLHFSAGDIDGAVAVLRRELAVTEAPAARGETRLRLATLLALEAGDVSAALDQLEEARREGVVAEGTVELLQDLRERLDTVDERYVELLAALHREAKDTDRVIELFQWAAARAGDGAARMAWFERIYQVRTGEQDNDQGAYAVTKIMLRLDPAWPELPERLFLHAEAAGAEEDLAGFLDGVLSDGDAVLPEDLDVRLRRELARLLQVRLARPADAAVQWEALRGALDGGTAAEARAALEGIYRDLGEWAPYAAV
ncbi:MAG: hypothetical protein FJ098_16640, partial [Deltaproteobacteria bacterium]|nr:hypothetical protein [Deltaproteobacteria bacterium]